VESQALQALALRVGEATTTDEVFKRIVEGLAAQDGVALARVWLIQPGDICEACRLREECPASPAPTPAADSALCAPATDPRTQAPDAR
jgi:hypothetical protein